LNAVEIVEKITGEICGERFVGVICREGFAGFL
jgi:hypothetical protein